MNQEYIILLSLGLLSFFAGYLINLDIKRNEDLRRKNKYYPGVFDKEES